MNRLWDIVIRPIIESIDADYIVEVGSDKGSNTENILEYCITNDARMTAIDPFPRFDIDAFKDKYGNKFEIYTELSLERLPLLEDFDVILLDGDHNWYTVYNELKIIEKSFRDKKFPVVFLHDIGWPYGRRDLYYNPESIPADSRHPYKKLGMYPGLTDLKKDGGLNSGLYNSIYENNSKNGVLTAVEDFIDESDLELSFDFVNAFHGLGILYPKNNGMSKVIKKYIVKNTNLSGIIELERVKLTIAHEESKSKNILIEREFNESQTRLKETEKQLKETEKQSRQTKNQLGQTEKQLRLIRGQVEELNAQKDNLTANIYEMEYLNNKNRSINQRLISKFPSLCILFNRDNHGLKDALTNIKGYRSIKKNNLFDIGYYLKNNGDIRESGADPMIHYIYRGYREGRKTNPAFDNEYYLNTYPDVKKSNMNPFIHYCLYGVKEGRRTTVPKFSIEDPNNKALRTLFFSHNLRMQGAQNSLYEIVTGLKNKDLINPVIFSPGDGPLRKAYEKNGIKVIVGDNKLQDARSFEEFNENLLLLIEKLEEFKFQFIHANTLRTFYGIEIARKMEIPCSWNPRESEPWETYFDYLPEQVKEIALNCFNYPYKIIFVSNYTRKIWEHFNNDNFVTIHNALNTERLIHNSINWTREESRVALGIGKNEIAIIIVGTVSERKGQKDIIRAVKDLPLEIIDNIKIFIIGDVPSEYSDELHELYLDLSYRLRKMISIIPETTKENEFFKVVDYYLAADILLFSSRIESYPRVILEALYFNLPIITTPVFGVNEQVEDGVSALFYEPGDIYQLRNQLLKLVKDDDLRLKLKRNTKKRMEELSTHGEMIDEYGKIILNGYLNNEKK